jgi:hypothetical protein
VLRIELLYVVALLAGLDTLFFDIAYRSLLPSLVRREQPPPVEIRDERLEIAL